MIGTGAHGGRGLTVRKSAGSLATVGPRATVDVP